MVRNFHKVAPDSGCAANCEIWRYTRIAVGFAAGTVLAAVSAQSWATCSPDNIGTAGPDTIICDKENDAEGADVDSLGGDDTLELRDGTIGSVYAGDGADTINITDPEGSNLSDLTDGEVDDNNSGEAQNIVLDAVHIDNLIDGGAGDDTITMDSRLARVGNFMDGGGITGGDGNDTIELLDGLAFHVWGGNGDDNIILDGGFVYNYIDGGNGNDFIYWDEGIANEVRGGDGSDQLKIDSFAYESGPILDGGDDLSSEDGYIDTLTFILDYEQDASLLRNWERIVIWGSSKMEFFGALDVGGGLDADGNDLGLDILFGGLVQFIPRHFVVTGNIANAGTLDLAYDDRFDTLTLSHDSSGNYGDYIGKNGRLWLDVRLYDDDSPADLFKIEGNTSGQTFIRVTNRDGIGALTRGDGIKLVEVDGNSPAGAFKLDGDFVTRDGKPAAIGGAFAYTLHHNGLADPADGNWYLRSTVNNALFGPNDVIRWQPGAVVYETYPQVLRTLNEPDTLRQRVGNRFWVGSSYKDVGNCDYPTSIERTIDGGGTWIRVKGRYEEMEPYQSTTSSTWHQDLYELQLGVDAPLNFTVRGTQPIVSVALHYGDSETEIDSFFGDGNIDVEEFGVSGYLTWYGIDGSYVDSQLHLNWFDSDLKAHDLRQLAEGVDAFGYALSLEGGRSFKFCEYYSVTPHVQITYSSEEADDIRDEYYVRMTDANNNAFRLRIGAVFDKRISGRKFNDNMFGDQPLQRVDFYITPSVLYNFGEKTDITVDDTKVYQEEDDWRGELSFGATYDECGDNCSIYGEINVSSSLENFGDSTSAGLEFGFRFKW